jgi:hypothetical protein
MIKPATARLFKQTVTWPRFYYIPARIQIIVRAITGAAFSYSPFSTIIIKYIIQIRSISIPNATKVQFTNRYIRRTGVQDPDSGRWCRRRCWRWIGVVFFDFGQCDANRLFLGDGRYGVDVCR